MERRVEYRYWSEVDNCDVLQAKKLWYHILYIRYSPLLSQIYLVIPLYSLRNFVPHFGHFVTRREGVSWRPQIINTTGIWCTSDIYILLSIGIIQGNKVIQRCQPKYGLYLNRYIESLREVYRQKSPLDYTKYPFNHITKLGMPQIE